MVYGKFYQNGNGTRDFGDAKIQSSNNYIFILDKSLTPKTAIEIESYNINLKYFWGKIYFSQAINGESKQFGDDLINGSGGSDSFLGVTDMNYNPISSVQISTGSYSSINDVYYNQTDKSILIAGEYSGTVGLGEKSLQSLGGNDIFLAKLNESYEPLWIKEIGSLGRDEIKAVHHDGEDTFLAMNLGSSEIIEDGEISTSEGRGIILYRIDAEGNIVWNIKIPGTIDTQWDMGWEEVVL